MRVGPEEDDDVEDLPPMDGDGGDAPESPEKFDDFPSPDNDTEADTSLDDSTAEDDPTTDEELDTDADEGETGWLDEPSDPSDVDVGEGAFFDAGEEPPLDPRFPALDDGEDPPIEDEDFGVGERADGEASGIGGAEEGPTDPDEELRDGDLPALDADDLDDEDSPEDSALLDERVAGDEPLGLPWAADPWVPVGTSWTGIAGVTAIAGATGGALVAGRTESGARALVRLDLEGGRRTLAAVGLEAGVVRALAVEGESVAVVSHAGRIFWSADGGETFESLDLTGNVAAADVVVASGVLWARTRTGSLLAARWGRSVERCAVPGVVAAIAADGTGGMVALALDDGAGAATLVRGGSAGADPRAPSGSTASDAAATVRCEAIECPSGRPPTRITARGSFVAYAPAAARGGVVRRGRGGAWQRSGWEGKVPAIALIDAEGTLLAAVYSDTDDTTALVRLDAAGRATLVARIGPTRDDPESDGRVMAMAWDDAHGVVWLAGVFGVAAFATR